MRGFIVGSLALIALQVLVSGQGPDRAAGLLGWTSKALEKALSPDVAAIPQTKTATANAAPKTTTPPTTSSVPGSATGLAAINV